MKNDKEYEKLLGRAARYCSLSEKSELEVRSKLLQWKADISDEWADKILQFLKDEKYIDNSRYASYFVADKHRLNRWGPFKIRMELRIKGVDESHINAALAEIEREEWVETLDKLLAERVSRIRGKSPTDHKRKLYNYAYTKGYPADIIEESLSKLNLWEEADDW